MIIIDGPDNVGKTTFIKKLAKALDFTVRGFGQEIQKWGPEDLLNSLYLDCLEHKEIDFAEDPAQWDMSVDSVEAPNIIYDRYHMSNFIYGKVIRKSDNVSAHDARTINRHLKAAKLAYTILILPTNMATYEKNLRTSIDQDFNVDQNMAVAECFNLHAAYLEPNDIIYVNEHPSSKHVRPIVKEYCSWRGINDPFNPAAIEGPATDITPAEDPGIVDAGDSEDDDEDDDF